MSLRHALLGMLAVEPGTGYDLARKFDVSLATAWHASHSQIYPELARLHDEGMLEVVGEGARRSRTYAVTDAGHEELRAWMLETEPVRTRRDETAVRWFLMALLEPADRRVALERELEHLEGFATSLESTAELLDGLDEPHPFRPTVDLGLAQIAVMRTWLDDQLRPLPTSTP